MLHNVVLVVIAGFWMVTWSQIILIFGHLTDGRLFCSVYLELSCTHSSSIPLEGSAQWRALCCIFFLCPVTSWHRSVLEVSLRGVMVTFHLRIHRLVIYTKSCNIVLTSLTQPMASKAAHWRPQEMCALSGGMLKRKGRSCNGYLQECVCVKIAMSCSVMSTQSSSFTV